MNLKTNLLTFHRLWGHTIIIAIVIAIVSGWQRGLVFAWAVIFLDSILNAISAVFSNEAAEPTGSDEITLKLSRDNCNELICAMIVAISYVKTAADEHPSSEPEDKEHVQCLIEKTETWRDILRQVVSVLQKEQDG